MGPLENKMHEKFVQEYVKNGRNGLQAYKAVYPNVKDRSAGACAARLLAVARVAERFKELQAASAEGAKVTLEGLIKRLGDTATNATNDKQHSAAVAALVAQAKLAGFWVDRTEAQNTNMNYAISDQPMSEEEWAKRYVTEH